MYGSFNSQTSMSVTKILTTVILMPTASILTGDSNASALKVSSEMVSIAKVHTLIIYMYVYMKGREVKWTNPK